MKQLTVVIPNKAGQTPEMSVRSLYRQSFTDFDIIIINDTEGNANKARNTGLKMVHTPFVLFCDNDINWCATSLADMMEVLRYDSKISYAYGSYELNGKIWCNQEWNATTLKRRNYVSTMSIVRTADHPGWDENIKRLQDWDVWLTMLEQGKTGRFTGKLAFSTPLRDGITTRSVSWEEAIAAIRAKHGNIE